MAKRAWVVATSLLLLVTACSGGSGDDDDADAQAKEAFLPRAEAVCDETAARIAERQTQVDQTDADALQAYVVFVAEQVLLAVEDLRALGLPDADADELEAALDTYEDRFTAFKEDPESVSATSGDEELRDAAAYMAGYGLAACGGGVS